MLTPRSSSAIYLLLLATVLYAAPMTLAEEPEPSSEPPARWWTLADEITPAQLRAIHQDTAKHRERFRAATDRDERPQTKGIDDDELDFFIDGSTHPELFEMWLAFDAFAVRFGAETAERRESLARFGFRGEELNTLSAFFDEYYAERQALSRELSVQMKPMVDFARRARQRMSEQRYVLAIRTNDAKMLADATGEDLDRVEELLALKEMDPLRDLAIESLPLLKEILEPSAWQKFRRYLLEVQASGMVRVDASAYRNKTIEGK